MAIRYRIVRLPEDVFQKYYNTKLRMETDIQKVTRNPHLRLTMPKVFNAVIDPSLNENFIEIDLLKLSQVARKKRGKYGL